METALARKAKMEERLIKLAQDAEEEEQKIAKKAEENAEK